MSNYKYYNAYTNRPKAPGEVNSGEVLVQTTGILKPEVEFERYMRAGKNLMQHRQDQYDFDQHAKIEGVLPDPTRNGLDLAENSVMLRNQKRRYMQLLAAKQHKVKLENAVKSGDVIKDPQTGEYKEKDNKLPKDDENTPPPT